MQRLVRSVREMTWATRREFLVVVVLAVGAEIGVRSLPLERLARLYGVRFAHATSLPPEPQLHTLPPWAWRRLRVVGRVMRHWPVDGVCLRQSLVAGQRIRTLHPELKLGVARSDAVEAHAWLEVDGKTLDNSSSLYAELPRPG